MLDIEIKNQHTNQDIGALKESRMSLILDGYEDIFSVFDPRPYSERGLSDDFLEECKKLINVEKIGVPSEIRLLVPKDKRDTKSEQVIKKRLHGYFLMLSHIKERQIRNNILGAWGVVVLGIIIGVIVSCLIHQEVFNTFFITLVTVIGEPASWILIWTGAEKLMQFYWKDSKIQNFYEIMASAKIAFYEY